MPNTAPHSAIDIPEIMSRNLAARDIVPGFASAMPTLVGRVAAPSGRTGRHVGTWPPEVARLSARTWRPRASGTRTRLPRCAPRSAHSATASPTPLDYIRDELSAPQNLSEAREGGDSDQLPPNAPASPPDPPWRHAAHDVHQRRPQPVPDPGRRDPRPVRLALPFRTGAARGSRDDATRGLLDARRVGEVVGTYPRRFLGGRGAHRDSSARGSDSRPLPNASTRPRPPSWPADGSPWPRSWDRSRHRYREPWQSARRFSRCRGGRTDADARRCAWNASSRHGRISRGRSASSALRSCPPPSMCGDGARGSGSHAARPSPT